MNPNRDKQRRAENSLNIWILEAKGIPSKRRYFCELCLGNDLYARTSAKSKADICFWGEFFEFICIPQVENICITIYREADPKKKKDRSAPIGIVQINIDQIISRHPVEKWYTITPWSDRISSGSNGVSSTKSNNLSKNFSNFPSIRVKAKYQTVDILPLKYYSKLLEFIECNYLPLCLLLEPVLGVKAKEDLATSLVRILHKKRLAKSFLCDLIMSEVNALENDHLMFRGNSLATKAMEAYMKLVAADYLQITLGSFVKDLFNSSENCEVDPLKLDCHNHRNASSFEALLERNRHNLMLHAKTAWGRILENAHFIPTQLRQVFYELRERLKQSSKADLANNLISSSIFLRFLCPAILTPSLFNLISEYPSDPVARNLTLIAKTLQTLANFTKFGGKESYMEFMNEFVEQEWNRMNEFLIKISRLNIIEHTSDIDVDASIDFGKELSLLHFYLEESWSTQLQEKVKQENDNLSFLWLIIVDISAYKDQKIYKNDSLSVSRSITSLSNYVNDETHNISLNKSQSLIKEDYNLNMSNNHNPPSDYENNVFDIKDTNLENQLRKCRSQPMSQNYQQRIVQNKTMDNLNTIDDYVIASALLKDETISLNQTGHFAQLQRLNKFKIQQKSQNLTHNYDPQKTALIQQYHIFDDLPFKKTAFQINKNYSPCVTKASTSQLENSLDNSQCNFFTKNNLNDSVCSNQILPKTQSQLNVQRLQLPTISNENDLLLKTSKTFNKQSSMTTINNSYSKIDLKETFLGQVTASLVSTKFNNDVKQIEETQSSKNNIFNFSNSLAQQRKICEIKKNDSFCINVNKNANNFLLKQNMPINNENLTSTTVSTLPSSGYQSQNHSSHSSSDSSTNSPIDNFISSKLYNVKLTSFPTSTTNSFQNSNYSQDSTSNYCVPLNNAKIASFSSYKPIINNYLLNNFDAIRENVFNCKTNPLTSSSSFLATTTPQQNEFQNLNKETFSSSYSVNSNANFLNKIKSNANNAIKTESSMIPDTNSISSMQSTNNNFHNDFKKKQNFNDWEQTTYENRKKNNFILVDGIQDENDCLNSGDNECHNNYKKMQNSINSNEQNKFSILPWMIKSENNKNLVEEQKQQIKHLVNENNKLKKILKSFTDNETVTANQNKNFILENYNCQNLSSKNFKSTWILENDNLKKEKIKTSASFEFCDGNVDKTSTLNLISINKTFDDNNQ